jgi:protein involved in polysaccharide export with SLBB domain
MFRSLVRAAVLVSLVAFSAGAAFAGHPIHNAKYRVRKGDFLEVRIPGEGGGTDVYEVSKSGAIELPKAGRMDVRGRSLETLEQLAAVLLGLKTAEEKEGVRFRVDEFAAPRATFMGLVDGEMGLPVGRRIRLLEALALSKGLGRADVKEVTVTLYRKGQRKRPVLKSVALKAMLVDGDLTANIEIQDGDVLIVAQGRRKERKAGKTRGVAFVLGAHQAPVDLPDDREVRLLELLAMSDALGTERVDLRNVVVRRMDDQGKPFEFEIDLADILDRNQEEKNLLIRQDDLVVLRGIGEEEVADDRKVVDVYVLGRVGRPGRIAVPEDELTLRGLLPLAGGIAEGAWAERVKVIRQTPEGRKVLKVDLRAVLDGKADDVELRADDLVYVPLGEAGESR